MRTLNHKEVYLGWKLVLNSIRIGFSALIKIRHINLTYLKRTVVRILNPLDIIRYYELPATWKELGTISKNDKLLDLSSPKLLAVTIAKQIGCNITATDIWPEEIHDWKNMVGEMKNIDWQVADGRSLPFGSETFDHIFSVSVIEHIPNKGDIKTVKELSRVLKPGGRLIITVPSSHEGKKGYSDEGIYGTDRGRQFWARSYSPTQLKKRIIKASGLSLEKLEYGIQTKPIFSRLHAKHLPYSALFGWLYFLLAFISIRINPRLSPNFPTGTALIVLEKK